MVERDLAALTHGVNPFDTSSWHGRWVSLDGTEASAFTPADVAEVVHEDASDDDWDGTAAAVFRLNDGRFACYETFWGPTGDGFHEDAYGGDADVSFAANLDTIVRIGLTDEGRRLCGIADPDRGSMSTSGEGR